MHVGRHTVNPWSATHQLVSLSTGEAEFYSLVKGASVGMGLQAMLRELEVDLSVRVKTDASAAVGMVKGPVWERLVTLTSVNSGSKRRSNTEQSASARLIRVRIWLMR